MESSIARARPRTLGMSASSSCRDSPSASRNYRDCQELNATTEAKQLFESVGAIIVLLVVCMSLGAALV
jgi:hypothetical protein